MRMYNENYFLNELKLKINVTLEISFITMNEILY